MNWKSCKEDAPSDSLALGVRPISSQMAVTALDSPAAECAVAARAELLCTICWRASGSESISSWSALSFCL
eukprot:1556695-Amphidinium_carterae.1